MARAGPDRRRQHFALGATHRPRPCEAAVGAHRPGIPDFMPKLFVRLADRAVEALAVLMTLALLAVVILGVVSRAMNDPFVWTDELARYLMVWAALLGWSIASRRRSHIRITLIMDLLPQAARRWLELFLQL